MFVREFRGQGNAPGAAVQLCTLSWLGFGPDEVASAPTAAVARLAEWLGTVLAGSTTAWNRPAQQAARRLAATRRCRAARHRPGRPRRGGRRCPRLRSDARPGPVQTPTTTCLLYTSPSPRDS